MVVIQSFARAQVDAVTLFGVTAEELEGNSG
jgi:hypothetical protein